MGGSAKFGRVVKLVVNGLRTLLIIALALWSVLAIQFSNLPTGWLRTLATGLYLLLLAVILWRIRPWWRARWACFGMFALVILWFLFTPPSNDRDWQPDVALLPYAETKGNLVTIHNIRNCDYRSETDYTVRHYDKTFDLDKLRSVDLFLVYWGSPLIAHTMLSFGFQADEYICFSIETRKQKGEDYSALKGFFRQFELAYVIGDERDLVRLRTNFRHEQVYLYRLHTDLGAARLVFLDYLKAADHLKDHPEWYNALTSNCTTTIRGHTKPYAKNARFDWRIVFNGRIDELGYERKTLDQSLPFNELKSRSLINRRAEAADNDEAFSVRIREGLPGLALTAARRKS